MSITAEKIAAVFDDWSKPSKLQLHAGEMTAGELRTVRAILPAVKAAVVSLLQQGEPEGALRKAYNKIEQHMFDYTHETHSYDASTNAWECSNGEVVAYVEGLDKALEIIKPLLSASPLPPAPGAETGGRRLGTAEALQFSDFRKLPEGVRKHFEEIEIFLSDVDGKDLATFTEDSAIDDGTIDCEGVVRAVNAIAAWVQSSSRQAVLEEADYFASLVSRARAAATKATTKFPQPNYVTLKIAEEAGEVVRGCVHYAEKRMDWSEVEGEIVQLLAMLIRLVTEGDQVNGVIPPLATTPPAEGERK